MRAKYLKKLFTLKRIKAFTKREMENNDQEAEVVSEYLDALFKNDHQRHKCPRELLHMERAQKAQELRGKMKHKEPLNYLVLQGIKSQRGGKLPF